MRSLKLLSVLAAAAALLSAAPLHAQLPEQAIRGRVVDRETDRPVAAVTLRVTAANGATVTGQSNAAGLFSIRVPAEGTYTITAEGPGYTHFTSAPVRVAPRAVLQVRVRMAAQTEPATPPDRPASDGRERRDE